MRNLFTLINCLVLLFCFSTVQAQIPFAVGGDSTDTGTEIVRDAAGNLYVAGIFGSDKPVDFDPGGGVLELTGTDLDSDIALAKYSPNGKVLWAIALKGPGPDVVYSAALSPIGNSIYIAGTFSQTLDFDPTSNGNVRTASALRDIFVAKYSTIDGGLIWAINMGGTGIDVAFDLAVDAQDAIYVSGVYQSVVDFDPSTSGNTTLTTAGSFDNFLARYSGADGSFNWVVSIGGIEPDFSPIGGTGVAVDNGGGVYVTGPFAGTVDFDPDPVNFNELTAASGTDLYVARYNDAGALQWVTGFGGVGEEYSSIGSIQLSSNGNVIISGGFEQSAEAFPLPGPIVDAAGGTDILLAGFDSATGTNIWAKGFGGFGNDFGLRLQTNINNEIYLTGSFQNDSDFDPLIPSSFILKANGINGASDVFVAKYGPIGNFIWAVSAGPTVNGAAFRSVGVGVAIDPFNAKLWVTGRFHGTTDFDPGTGNSPLVSKGLGDIFVWGLDADGNLDEQILCPAPSSLATSSLTENSALIDWPAVAQATGYEVSFGELTNPNPVVQSGLIPDEFAASSLIANTVYKIIVRTECGVDRSVPVDFLFTTSTTPPLPCPLPTIPAVSEVSPNRVRVSWAAFPQVFSYEVSYREIGSPAWITVDNLPTNTIVLENLKAGTNHEVRIRNLCTTEGFTPFSDIKQFNTPGVLDACLNDVPTPVIEETGNTFIRLSWASVSAINFYQLHYRLVGDPFWQVLPGTPATQMILSDLLPNSVYEFRLRNNCQGTFSGFSPIVQAQTGTIVSPTCSAPLNIRIEEIGRNRAVVRWDALPNAQSYTVSYRTVQGLFRMDVPNIGAPELVLENLIPDTEYGIMVLSRCFSGQSIFSSELVFRTESLPFVCPIPGLATGDIGETTAVLIAGQAEASYEVEFRAEASPVFTLAIGNGVPFTLVNLLPDTRYIARIRNRCANGSLSEYSNLVGFQTGKPFVACPTPAQLFVEPLNATAVRVSWNEIVPFYELAYRPVGTSEWTSGFFTETGPILLDQLLPETLYEVRLTPICDGEESMSSPILNFTTGEAPQCETPVVSLESVGENSAILSWFPSTSPYEYGIRRTGESTFGVVASSTLPPFQLIDLQAGTTYEFRVRNFCPNGAQSSWSSVVSLTTRPRTFNCTQPEPVVEFVTQSTAVVIWPVVADAIRYEVLFGLQGSLQLLTLFTEVPSIAFSNLMPGMTYRYQVRSYCATDSRSLFTEVRLFQTSGIDCSTPVLTLTDATVNSLIIDVFPESALGYVVEYRPQNGADFITLNARGGSFIEVPGLPSGVSYEVRLRSRCENDVLSDLSNSIFATTEVPPVCPVPELSLLSAGTNVALLDWQPKTFEAQLEYRIVGEPNFISITTSTGPVPFSLSNLIPSSLYEVRVRNRCDFGLSEFSNLLIFQTLNLPVDDCPEPVLSILTVDRNFADFSWTPFVAAYEISFRLASSANWSTFVSNSQQPFRLNNLTSGTDYEFRVRNVCPGNRFSEHSNIISFRTLDGQTQSCASPIASISSVQPNEALVSWLPIAGASQYEVELMATSGTSSFASMSASIRLTNLLPQTTYTVRVRSICASGTSPFSGARTFTTLPILPPTDGCATPFGLDFSNITISQATVQWSVVPGATRYQLQWRFADNPTTLRSLEVISNSVVIPNLSPNSFYEVQVRAFCSNGQVSTFTSFRRFQTPQGRMALSEESGVQSLTIYPNPTRGPLVLSGIVPGKSLNLMVLDATGKTVWNDSIETQSEKLEIDLSILTSGVYQMIVVSENERQAIRILIQ